MPQRQLRIRYHRPGHLKIAKQAGVDQVVAVRIVQATLDSMIAALATESRLELRDFGVFEVRAAPKTPRWKPYTCCCP